MSPREFTRYLIFASFLQRFVNGLRNRPSLHRTKQRLERGLYSFVGGHLDDGLKVGGVGIWTEADFTGLRKMDEVFLVHPAPSTDAGV